MSKYYTPDISEFHVGFEYEYNKAPQMSDGTDIERLIFRDGFNEFVRVKYLDREDIESLGWEFEEGKLRANFLDTFTKEDLTLEIKYDNQKVNIEHSPSFFHEYPMIKFQGTIKNKSELSRILKMIGVI